MKKLLLTILLSPFFFAPSLALAWDEYFDNSEYYDVKMSPDGKHLGVITIENNKRMLAFYDVATSSVTGGVQLPGKFEVGPFFWANNERVVIKLWRKAEDKEDHVYEYTGELFGINVDGTRSEMIYGVRSGEQQTGTRLKTKKAVEAWANVIDGLPNKKRHILISSELMTKSEDNSRHLFQLDVIKGTTSQRITSAPIMRADYFTDSVGNLKAASGTDRNYLPQLYIRSGASWEKVAVQPGTKFQVVGVDRAGQYLYTIDNLDSSKASIYKLNLNTGEYKNIYSHEKHDVASILFSPDRNSIYGARLVDENNTHVYLKNTADAKLHKSLSDLYPGKYVTITDTSPNLSESIVHIGSSDDAGEFYIFHNNKNELKRLTQSKAKYTIVWKNPMEDARARNY